jgi:hypothetical protein
MKGCKHDWLLISMGGVWSAEIYWCKQCGCTKTKYDKDVTYCHPKGDTE